MRVRFGILGIVLIAVLTACGGSGTNDASGQSTDGSTAKADPSLLATPTKALTEITVPCAKFEAAAKRIVDAQRDLYSNATKDGGAIDKLVAELNALKDGAPDDVKSALTELGDAFKGIAEMGSKPSQELAQKMSELAPKLAVDGQKITAYITSKCT